MNKCVCIYSGYWLHNSQFPLPVNISLIDGPQSTHIKVWGWNRFLFKLTFLGAYAKLRKTTIRFVMSVRPSVRMQQVSSRWTDLYEI